MWKIILDASKDSPTKLETRQHSDIIIWKKKINKLITNIEHSIWGSKRPKHVHNTQIIGAFVAPFRKFPAKRAILIFHRKGPAITEHVEHVTKIIRLSFLIRSYIRSISRSSQPPKHFVSELKSHINLPNEKAGPRDGPGNTNERVPIAKVGKSTGKTKRF